MRRCGVCMSEIADLAELPEPDPDRCPCGKRRITRLGYGVVLAHKEGCEGGDCRCGRDLGPEIS